MKASISNRIYLKCSEKYHQHILNNLTYKITPSVPLAKPEIICDVFRIKDISSIPVGRTDLIPENYEIVDNRITVERDFGNLKKGIQFRDNQQEAIDFVKGNCIINAKPAWGKTFTAVGIARKLKQKTLVVVHTIFLRDQWNEEIKKILNIQPGIIGSGLYEKDSPIVIGNVQTLANKMDELKNDFGLIIVDECHHIPASTFKKY